jgi:hypothetical protein
LNIAVGDMLSTNPEREASCALFCKSIFTKPLVFESTLSVFTDALVQLEKFFYQGLKHKGVQLPAAINFAHYTHGTGQVRSNAFINSPWQLREFKTDIDAYGRAKLMAAGNCTPLCFKP